MRSRSACLQKAFRQDVRRDRYRVDVIRTASSACRHDLFSSKLGKLSADEVQYDLHQPTQ